MIRFTIFFYIYNPNCFNILLYNFFNMKEMINLEKYMENFYWYWNIEDPEIIFVWIEEGWNEPLKNILKWINDNKNHIYFDIKNKNFTIDFFEFHKKFYSNIIEKYFQKTWTPILKILCYFNKEEYNKKEIWNKYFKWNNWNMLFSEIFPLRSWKNDDCNFEKNYLEIFKEQWLLEKISFSESNNDVLREKYEDYIFQKREENLREIIFKESVKNIVFYWKNKKNKNYIEKIIWEKFEEKWKDFFELEKNWKKIILIKHPTSPWWNAEIYLKEISNLLKK